MTQKIQFIEAIKIVLNIEENLLIAVVVEQIATKVKESDYKEVILYLAKRKSEYERPLERLAKGVDEFYEAKRQRILDYARDHSNTLNMIILDIKEQKGKEETISLVTAGRKFKLPNNVIFEVTSQDITAIENAGGLKHLIENREYITDVLYKHHTKSLTEKSNEVVLLA